MTEHDELEIKTAAKVLIASGAREVYCFGSAATNTMRSGSDVELAISGLPPERFYRAVGQALRMLSRPVDVVDLDEQTPFTEHLRNKGRLQRVA